MNKEFKNMFLVGIGPIFIGIIIGAYSTNYTELAICLISFSMCLAIGDIQYENQQNTWHTLWNYFSKNLFIICAVFIFIYLDIQTLYAFLLSLVTVTLIDLKYLVKS